MEVLHRHELVPAVLLCDVLERLELPCRHGGGADIADFARLDNVIESFHDLLAGCVAVEAVDLEDLVLSASLLLRESEGFAYVNVRAQPLNTAVNSIKNMLATQADLIDPVAVILGDGSDAGVAAVLGDAEVAFTEDDDFAAGDFVLLECFGDDAFAVAVGVDVRGVPGVQADVVGVLEQGE